MEHDRDVAIEPTSSDEKVPDVQADPFEVAKCLVEGWCCRTGRAAVGLEQGCVLQDQIVAVAGPNATSICREYHHLGLDFR